MSVPVRLRLSRKKGFDLQAWSREVNGLPAVKVDRSTMWGNMVAPRLGATGEYAVEVFRAWVEDDASDAWKWRASVYLRGNNLGCWCKLDAACHADVLLKLANGNV